MRSHHFHQEAPNVRPYCCIHKADQGFCKDDITLIQRGCPDAYQQHEPEPEPPSWDEVHLGGDPYA